MLKKFLFVVLTANMFVAYESTLGQSNNSTRGNGLALESMDNTNTKALAATVEESCIISRFDHIMRAVGE